MKNPSSAAARAELACRSPAARARPGAGLVVAVGAVAGTLKEFSVVVPLGFDVVGAVVTS
jgi:hypothetical protein